MNSKDKIPPFKVSGIRLMVFEGDIQRDENGRITNKLVTVIETGELETTKEDIINGNLD